MREIWVQSLGCEDPLDKEMATHSSILAWRIPMDRRTWWATVHGVTEMDTTEWLSQHTHMLQIAFQDFICLTHTHTHTLYSSPRLDLWSPQESFVPDCDLPTHQSSWHEIFLNVWAHLTQLFYSLSGLRSYLTTGHYFISVSLLFTFNVIYLHTV